ncbi:ABC transporter permease, partial [Streptomyces sp. FT05W]
MTTPTTTEKQPSGPPLSPGPATARPARRRSPERT